MTRLVFTLFLLLTFTISGYAQTKVLTLQDCIKIALKENANVKINRNLNESAEEGVVGSYSGILPTVNLTANTGRVEAGEREVEQDVPVGIDPDDSTRVIYDRSLILQPGYIADFNNFGISVNQNLFDGGEWWNAISYAKTQKEVSDRTLESTLNNTILDVQEKFFDLLKAQKLLEVNELAVSRSQDQLDKTQKMFDLGAVAKVDVFRSRVNLGNDKINMLLQKNAVSLAKNNLNLSMGRQPETPVDISAEGLEINQAYSSADEYVAEGLDKNPELRRSEAEVRSQSLQTSRAHGVLWPALGIFFNYNRSNEGIERVYGKWDKNWNINYGLSLRFNVFNGLRDKVQIQKAKLEERNALERYEDNKRTLKATIRQYINDFNSYLEIIEINEDNLEAAKEEYRLAEERYRIGSGTQLEVREAQVNLTGAEETLVRAKYSALVTQALLANSLGTMYMAPGEMGE
jgi:outer membrane protein TolC